MGGTDRVRVDQLGGERGDRKDEARGEERNNNNQNQRGGIQHTHTCQDKRILHTSKYILKYLAHTYVPSCDTADRRGERRTHSIPVDVTSSRQTWRRDRRHLSASLLSGMLYCQSASRTSSSSRLRV